MSECVRAGVRACARRGNICVRTHAHVRPRMCARACGQAYRKGTHAVMREALVQHRECVVVVDCDAFRQQRSQLLHLRGDDHRATVLQRYSGRN